MSKGELPGAARLLARVTDPEDAAPSVVYAVPDVATLRTLEALWPSAILHTFDYAVKRAQTVADLRFGAPPAPGDGWVAVLLPKGKELTRWLLATLAVQIESGRVLWLVGGKDEGIGSAARLGGEGWVHFDTVAYGNHARIESFVRTSETSPAPPLLRPLHASVETVAGTVALEVQTAPGVFSAEGLDEASRMLLRHLPTDRVEAALDVGCGAGWFARFLLQTQRAARVEAVDTSWTALEASRASLAPFGAAATVRASEGLSDVSGSFDVVVSNPPFHQGHAQTTDPTLRIIADIPRVLRPGGRLYLVANRFLPYLEALGASFERVTVVHETGRFRLYRAEGPRSLASRGRATIR